MDVSFKNPILIFLFGFCLEVHAGEKTPGTVLLQSDTDTVHLEGITVTARKREEHANSIAGQLSVYQNNDIESGRIESIEELFFLTPSLNYINPGNAAEAPLVMRGVGTLALGEPSVGFFVDGIYMGADSYITGDMFDVERIEILHGPQPTLYGKSTTGGIINLITKLPTEDRQTNFRTTFGDGPRYRVSGSSSGALVAGNLLGRVALSYENFDGYDTNSFNGNPVDDNEEIALRASLVFFPNDNLTITPTVSIRDQDQQGFHYRRVQNERDYEGQPFSRDDANDLFIQTQNASIKVEYDFNDMLLTSISALNNNDEDYAIDGDYSASPNFFFKLSNEVLDFSQELRLTSGQNNPLRWLVGTYYFSQKSLFHQTLFSGGSAGTPFGVANSEDHSTTYSLFGEIDYKLINRLTLGAGLRLDHDQREQKQTGLNQEKEFTNLSTKLSLKYDFTQNFMMYGSYALAYRPGGFNEGTLPEFDTEKTNAYEVGIKSNLWGNTTLTGAIFFTDIEDQQVFELDPATLSAFTSNKGNAEIYGLEINISSQITDHVNFSFGATLLDARFKDYQVFTVGPNGTGTFDLSGNKLHIVPEYEAVAVAQYSRPITSFFDNNLLTTLRVEARFSGEQQWDDFNSAHEKPFQIVNASYELVINNLKVKAFVDNIFDEDYFSNFVSAFRFPPTGGSSVAVRGEERYFGINLSASF